MIEPLLTMLWWVAKALALAALWALAPAAIAVLFYYVVKPESQSLDLPPSERLGPAVDVTAGRWEQTEASRLMVEDACERLHKRSLGQHFIANRGADYTAIYDVTVKEHFRLLEQDPRCYE